MTTLPSNIVEPVITLRDGYFDLRGLEEYSSIKVPTLRDYIKSGDLPCFKLKGKILVRKSEFDEWMEEYRVNKKKNINNIVDEVLNSLKGE
jgi:excisionase family DNA binding protein